MTLYHTLNSGKVGSAIIAETWLGAGGFSLRSGTQPVMRAGSTGMTLKTWVAEPQLASKSTPPDNPVEALLQAAATPRPSVRDTASRRGRCACCEMSAARCARGL